MSKKEKIKSDVVQTNSLIPAYRINHSDPLKKYNKLYTILIILGAGFGLLQGGIITAIGIAGFGFLIAWIIVRVEAIIKLTKLNLTNYPLSAYVSEDKILEYLKQSFSNDEVVLNHESSKISFLYKNETRLTIKFNKENCSFSITPRMTIGQKLKNGGRANSAKLYVNTQQVTPYLVHVIQDAVNSLSK